MNSASILIIIVSQIFICALVRSDLKPRIDDEDANLDVPQIIAKYGYPVQVHEVTTQDGYMLTMHRIPGKPGSYVVWLQHGLLGDSSNWIFNSAEKALAYVLADAGYDVWIGNSRGNRYSKKHQTLTPTDEKFWDFSFHEMGVFDLRAGIDYALMTSGQPDLFYFGHSQGTTLFWVLASERPEYNNKIRLMSAFAPLAYTDYMQSPLARFAPMSNNSEEIRQLLGAHEFLPSPAVMDLLGAANCRATSTLPKLCTNALFLIGGFNTEQFDEKLLNAVMGHTPGGTSVRNIVHFAQGVNSTVFAQFNHGAEKNLQVYGQEEPPLYDWSKIISPVAVYWAENDWVASPEGTYRITETIPILVRKDQIDFVNYTHLDFNWASDNDLLLINQSVDFMKYFITPLPNSDE